MNSERIKEALEAETKFKEEDEKQLALVQTKQQVENVLYRMKQNQK